MFKRRKKINFRSGLESIIQDQLKSEQVNFSYESDKIKYTIPERPAKYTPDFTIVRNDGSILYIEGKGRFVAADRKKHLLIREQHPELDIRFVFSDPNNRISKNSKTTYADWCNKYGFKYSKKEIPRDWLLN